MHAIVPLSPNACIIAVDAIHGLHLGHHNTHPRHSCAGYHGVCVCTVFCVSWSWETSSFSSLMKELNSNLLPPFPHLHFSPSFSSHHLSFTYSHMQVRYNLLSGKVCGPFWSFFWAVVAPWIITAFCYEADLLVWVMWCHSVMSVIPIESILGYCLALTDRLQVIHSLSL